MTRLKEFKMGDLFDLYMPKGLSNKDLEKLKTYKEKGRDDVYPLLKQTNTNNGISDYVSLPNEYLLNKENKTILIGTTNTQNLNVCDFPVYAMNVGNTYIIEHDKINKYTALYLKSAVDKVIVNKYSYNNLNAIFKMKEDLITLPVKSLTDTEPDWEYMEQYIKEIEKKAILKVKEQNEKDIALLKEIVGQEKGSDFTEDVEYREFKMSEIFDDFVVGKQPSEKNRFPKHEEGMLPVVTGVTINNGTGFFSYKSEDTVYENIITISKDGEYAGTPFYQNREVILGGHSLGCISRNITRYGSLYIMTQLSKYQKEDFWKQGGVMGSVPIKRLLDTKITLPVNKSVSEQVPDWKSIEEYMKHIQQKYIILKEQENEIEINNLLSVTGLTPELILSEEGQFA